ncbi:MAG: hypothetical protein J7L75_00295, partial [Thermoproteales archaeon]|nr:hypothetical protein [Thermoproteales archaeon]
MASGEVTLKTWSSLIKDFETAYLRRADWEVKENANTNFSYSNFRSYLFEKLVKRPEVLREYLPPRAVELHFRGDIHIHKLPDSLWIPYCIGWSYRRILELGLKTSGVVSRPARHFDTAVSHLANFFFMGAQEFTGAQATSAFDLYAAPFIKRDGLSYERVKQVLQGMLFELNYPARAGYQCLSEDTKILTPSGWKSYKDLREGDLIYTFNLQTRKIELKPVRKIFVYKYKGKMYSLRNRTQKQLISPNHRVVWVDFNDHDKVRYSQIEELLKYKSPIPVPTTAYPDFNGEDYPISDEELKLIAWFLADGSLDTSGRTFRVTIYQSEKANPDKYTEILELLNKLGMKYDIHTITTGFSPTKAIRLNAESSKRILKLIGVKAKKPPKWLYRLSRRQARLFIETYVKGDGSVESKPKRIRIVTTDEELRDALVAVAVLAGYNVSFTEKTLKSDISKKKQYQISLTSTRTDYIQRIEEVDYEGVIWSVNTENETVVAMREGCVFITGNSPFTNITLVLDTSKEMLRGEAIVGGRAAGQLGDYVDEALVVARALFELYLEGDALGQPFTFPIPTLMLTRSFDWSGRRWGELTDLIFQALARRGTAYLLNGYASNVEALYAMCCRLTIDVNHVMNHKNNSMSLKLSYADAEDAYERFLKAREDGKAYGIWALPDATGSIGVVTINLPRIAILSRGEWGRFEELLRSKLEEARKVLLTWRRRYERSLKAGLMPITRIYLGHFNHHFNTFGLIGLPEAAANFMRDPKLWSEGSRREMREAVEIERRMVRAVREYAEECEAEDGCLYNVEEIPGESTGYRLASLDAKMFREEYERGEIAVASDGVAPFYSNSIVPYYADVPLHLRAEWEGLVQQEFTGGVMMHLFLEEQPDPDALKR